MSIYVDNMRRRANITGRPAYWSHLMADTTEELEAFARRLGLRPSWIQHAGTRREHYDVTDTVRAEAIRLGAEAITYPHGTAKVLDRKRRATSVSPIADRCTCPDDECRETCPVCIELPEGVLCAAQLRRIRECRGDDTTPRNDETTESEGNR